MLQNWHIFDGQKFSFCQKCFVNIIFVQFFDLNRMDFLKHFKLYWIIFLCRVTVARPAPVDAPVKEPDYSGRSISLSLSVDRI